MDGVTMPTLREVIRYVKGKTAKKVGFQIEFKTDPEHNDWTFTPAEFALLALLAKNEGRVLTHQYILKEIWGMGYLEQTQYLKVFIA